MKITHCLLRCETLWYARRHRCFGETFSFLLQNFFFIGTTAPVGLGLPPWNCPFHFGFFLNHTQSVGLLGRVISSSQTWKNAHTQTLNIHALSGIRTHGPGLRASEDTARYRSATVTGPYFRIVYPKCRQRPNSVTSQKTIIFTVTAEKT
jgi:hypothetical protein